MVCNWRSECPSTLSSRSTEGVLAGEAKLVAHSSRRPMGTTPPPTTPPRLTACGVSPALHLPAGAESPPSLHVLCEEPDLLARHEPVPQVLDGGKLHLVPVFTVNVQEDAEEHQEAAPDVPETRRLGGET